MTALAIGFLVGLPVGLLFGYVVGVAAARQEADERREADEG